jgi:hypothetical protein
MSHEPRGPDSHEARSRRRQIRDGTGDTGGCVDRADGHPARNLIDGPQAVPAGTLGGGPRRSGPWQSGVSYALTSGSERSKANLSFASSLPARG